MCKHEEKNCPRCGTFFECKVGDIPHCQCYVIKLSDDERDFISKKFTDCLCANCIKALKSEYNILKRELQLKVFFTGR
jgi:Cysteine-rich CWC